LGKCLNLAGCEALRGSRLLFADSFGCRQRGTGQCALMLVLCGGTCMHTYLFSHFSKWSTDAVACAVGVWLQKEFIKECRPLQCIGLLVVSNKCTSLWVCW
jgi:hypothetical protein